MATPIENNTEGLQQILQKVNALPNAGGTKQEKSGTFTTDNSGHAVVNCGFKPDYVVISNPRAETYGYYVMSATAHFAYNPDGRGSWAVLVAERSENAFCNSFDVAQTDSGFECDAENVGWDMQYSFAINTSFNYYAVKYE